MKVSVYNVECNENSQKKNVIMNNNANRRKVFIFCFLMLVIFLMYFVLQTNIIKNKIYSSENEFLKTIDCAKIIDEHGVDNTYRLSFELRTEIPGEILVYFQNGTTSKYYFEEYISTTTEFQKYTIDLMPVIRNVDVEESYLAFYGGYGSGVIPYVKGEIFFEVIGN